jgi:NADPH-dependent F420 reductase
MNIAIIGSGNVGGALAEAAARAGHSITVTSRNASNAQKVAEVSGARAVESNREAVDAAEMVLLAVPYDAVDDVLADLGDAVRGKVLVDVSNRFAPDDPGTTMDGSSNAEQIQSRASGASVVKALNTVLGSRMADPVIDGIPLDGYVAGDDDAAKSTVLSFLESIGFRPLDAGTLRMARALEAMGTLNISLNMRHGWSWQNGWKLIGPA